MGTFNRGFKNIKVTLLSWEGDNLAKRVYDFGKLSNDIPYELTNDYNPEHPDCIKLINKIIEGTTLPKFALMGTRIEFRIENISRICLAQLTRDQAFFASAGGGVFPLTENFNIPITIYDDPEIMEKLKKAEDMLEDAYITAVEKGIPNLEARYLGLHCQTISLSASYMPSDFVRSCYSRTSSNFCDECNYVYRLMYRELTKSIKEQVKDPLSVKLYKWLFPENKCIYDGIYTRERLYNSDFTVGLGTECFMPKQNALNDWLKSGWKKELERMYDENDGYLTDKEKDLVKYWRQYNDILPSTYDPDAPDAPEQMIKKTEYYKKHRGGV